LTALFRFIGIVLLLLIVALTAAVLTMHFAIHGAEVTVPDFKGQTVAHAHRQASDLGLDLSIENRLYSAEIPAGRISNQSPAPGSIVRAGWPVRLTQSLGPQKVSIPGLAGLPGRVAALQIRRAGLQPATSAYLPTALAPEGAVLAQSPQPNAPGVESPVVHTLVAAPDDGQSTPAFVMPNLIGQIFTGAALTVTHAGLKLAPVKEVAVAIPSVGNVSSTAAPAQPLLSGSVIAQSPLAGYRVQPGDTVTLTIVR
jgi:beta-lactam-binding protein with PASTA domain